MAVALATAIVGCGGDDGDGFADATNRTCEDVSAAAKTLSTDLVRGPGDSESAAVKAAVERYATTVAQAAEQLQAASSTKGQRAFQQAAVRYLRTHADDLRAVAEGEGGSRADAIERLTATEGSPAPMVPPAVLDGAPACAEGSAR